ncbi:3-oxoacid CoA-transferase subunit B [Acetohalobium arabaticum]|uniref:Butyryl-CoA:acetoacetate CoA-transferase beta subunit n=1 Tax=Acetohalobium arabaticum (strain ATCC 49924 / DSM 5501 / Z-7288) TaxID=574087 RepID=D9QS53_ACEAZ|nr:3-oxoacid CoA-transferase subunit B [Acetohalobium arabaticum]ADL13344.1 butyryl-CoA:acetoacetate CoA-transferase beta subunit [Acetohalobium arabaticum DSM 5501]
MDKQTKREIIANRIAAELNDGDIVNLGIGLPTMVGDYVSDDIDITLQSENGFLGLGPAPEEGDEDKDLVNAGAQPVTIKEGGAFFDSADSFAIIRGGHVDITVLGALQADEQGNLANWMIPGKLVPGMGGAMDLVVGAQQVIIGTAHTIKGNPKILKECDLPLTAKKQVDLIVTEMGVMKVTEDGLVLREINPEFTVDEVQEATEAELIIPDDLEEMEV